MLNKTETSTKTIEKSNTQSTILQQNSCMQKKIYEHSAPGSSRFKHCRCRSTNKKTEAACGDFFNINTRSLCRMTALFRQLLRNKNMLAY